MVVRLLRTETRNLDHLYVAVLKAAMIGRRGTEALCTLGSPYKIAGEEPDGLRDLACGAADGVAMGSPRGPSFAIYSCVTTNKLGYTIVRAPSNH